MRRWLLISGLIGVAVALVRLAPADACQVPQNCVRGGCGDAGSYNCSNLPTTSSPPDAGPPAYLIPEDAGFGGTVLAHVNATDLQNGTARVGPTWTMTGTVPYNSSDLPRPTIGPFSASNYYSLPSSNPLNISSGPYTFVIIYDPAVVTSFPVILATGPLTVADGFSVQAGVAHNFLNMGTAFVQTTDASTVSSLQVLCGGMDGAGNAFVGLNGGTTSVLSPNPTGNTIATSSTRTYIGTDTTQTYNLNGTFTEAMVSTAVPSDAACASIYAAILANE